MRFIPLESSTLFALNRPFHAIIRNTKDPKIKKLVMLHDAEGPEGHELVNTILDRQTFERVTALAKRRKTSVSTVIEDIVQAHFEATAADQSAAAAALPATGGTRRDSPARRAREAALAAKSQTHTEGHAPAGPVDYIISNIVEAAVLILDALEEDRRRMPARKREETFALIHHALATLVALKHGEDGGFFSERGKERLVSVLEDLEGFRRIADEEEATR